MSSPLFQRCLQLFRKGRNPLRSNRASSNYSFQGLVSAGIYWMVSCAFASVVHAGQVGEHSNPQSASEGVSVSVSAATAHAPLEKRIRNHPKSSLHLIPETRPQDRIDGPERLLRDSGKSYSALDPQISDQRGEGDRSDGFPRLSLFEYDVGEALVVDALRSKSLDASVIAARESAILNFFQRKWRGSKSQAATMAHDFELMARYYAQHDAAYQLIERLRKQPVTLRYAADGFRTDVVGNRLAVRSVKIYFDPQSAAVLGKGRSARTQTSGQAVVSAADALLHELLHAALVLEQSKRFVAQGGLGGGLYPLQHEMDVIEQERQLFSVMTQADKIPRPQRHSHSGYLVAASCATCLK